ncbi:MAG: carboxypeptidase-like regulatory domain-containing protein [Bacteroidia bacterium]
MKRTILIFLALIPGIIRLQAQNATLRGQVSDSEGGALVGATVKIQNSQKGATTDDEGQYTIANLTAGTYQVTASYVGYASMTREVKVSVGQSTTLDFALEGGVIYGDQVVISGSKRPEKITESPATIVTVSALQIEEYAGNPAELLARQKGVDYFRLVLLHLL